MSPQNEISDTVQTATKRYELSREYTSPYFDRFLDNYKHYFLRIIDEAVEADEQAYPFYSQIMLPVSYQIVETLLPRMFSRMFNFNITTEEENDEMDETAMRELVKYQMNHPYLIDDPIFTRTATGLKECFITGNFWGSVPWYKKEIEVEEWQPYSSLLRLPPSWDILPTLDEYGVKPEWMLVKVKKTLIDAPVFEHKSIFHVHPDPKKKRVSELGWVIEEEMMTFEQIMDMVNARPRDFQNIDELKEMKANEVGGNSMKMTNYDQQLAEMFGSTDFSTKDDTQKQFKVWFMKEPEKLSIIINEKLDIRVGSNPYGDGKLGLFLMKDVPVPHELYAWGEPDPIKRLEDGMSDQFNMRNDSVFHDLLRMWKVDPTALVDGEEFSPEPGAVVQVKEMGAIEQLETGTTSSSAYREYQEWDQVIQNTTGVTDYATGANATGMNDTRGGVELLQQAANARFQFKLQLFENLALKAMGTMYVQRNMRFFDTPQMVNLDSKKGKLLITPERIRRIRGNIHFIVDAGSSEAVNTQTEINKWQTVLKLISENKPPFDNLSQSSKDKIAKRVLYALRVNDAEELLERDGATPESPQAMAEAMNGLSPEEAQAVQTATGGIPSEQPATEPAPQQDAPALPQDTVAQQA